MEDHNRIAPLASPENTASFSYLDVTETSDGHDSDELLETFLESNQRQDAATEKEDEQCDATDQLDADESDQSLEELLESSQQEDVPVYKQYAVCDESDESVESLKFVESIPEEDIVNNKKDEECDAKEPDAQETDEPVEVLLASIQEEDGATDKNEEERDVTEEQPDPDEPEVPLELFSETTQEQEAATETKDKECDEDCESFYPADLMSFAWQIARGMVSRHLHCALELR